MKQIIIEIETEDENLIDKIIADLNFLLGMRKEKITIVFPERSE